MAACRAFDVDRLSRSRAGQDRCLRREFRRGRLTCGVRIRWRYMVGRGVRPGVGRLDQKCRKRHASRRCHVRRRGPREDASDSRIPASGSSSPLLVERKVVFPPFQGLADAASGFGHNLFVLDSDGPLRHTVPFVRVGDRALPSLGLAAALRAAGINPRYGAHGERGSPVGRSIDAALDETGQESGRCEVLSVGTDRLSRARPYSKT